MSKPAIRMQRQQFEPALSLQTSALQQMALLHADAQLFVIDGGVCFALALQNATFSGSLSNILLFWLQGVRPFGLPGLGGVQAIVSQLQAKAARIWPRVLAALYFLVSREIYLDINNATTDLCHASLSCDSPT